MIEPASLAVFFAAALLLGISPGPDNLFVLAQSLIGGRRAGFMITLGLCTGLLVHTTAVALGVAAVIKTSSVAFLALKMAGAGYLLYLAWRAFRAGGSTVAASS
jgi:threonine/homoserine/homoserine lactone efflux protein